MRPIERRTVLATLVTSLCFPWPAAAQGDYPHQPVKLISGSAATVRHVALS